MASTIWKERRISYHIEGVGPTVVLVNGLFQSSSSWERVRDALASRYEVIAIDLPNQWESDDYPDIRSAEQYADFLTDFVASLGYRCEESVFIGFSFGASLLLRLSLLRQKVFKGLLLVCPVPIRYEAFFEQIYELNLYKFATGGVFTLAASLMPEMYSAEFINANPGMLAMSVKWFENAYERRMDALRALLSAGQPWAPAEELLATVPNYPIFVYEAAKERNFPRGALKPLASSLGAEYVEVDGGHMLMVERPEELSLLFETALDSIVLLAQHTGETTSRPSTELNA